MTGDEIHVRTATPDTDDCSMDALGVSEFVERPSLLPGPYDIPPPGDELCESCRELHFKPEDFVVLPGDEENHQEDSSIAFGKVEDVKKRTKCPLCRLVLMALSGKEVPSYEKDEPLYVSLAWSTDGPTPNLSTPWTREPEIRVLCPTFKARGGGLPDIELNLFPEITLLANDSPGKVSDYFLRAYDPDRIDFSVVRRWLELCESHHGEACQRKPVLEELEKAYPDRKVHDFRCIDVDKRCVTTPPSGSAYAALSYVWGGLVSLQALESNIEELETEGFFSQPEFLDRIPLTIRDAIDVTKKIGMRYLWVDSFCIVQDDLIHKSETIKTMDLVYSRSSLVIIAASSENAWTGIPGLRSGTREYRQPIEEIAPGFRLAFNDRWLNIIEGRSYYSRGWTYQETHFATRSLIFAGGKVVFRCQSIDAWEEHLIETPNDIKGQQRELMDESERDDIGKYEEFIRDYSGRRLSYATDVYNAFAGVSRQLMVQLNTDLCHGMPTIYLDWFMLWQPSSLQSRRLSDDGKLALAPSWSWSGWLGGSWPHMWDWYDRSIERIERAVKNRCWIIWYQRDGHDSTSCKQLTRHHFSRKSAPGSSKGFHGLRNQIRFDIDCSQTEPTRLVLDCVGTPTYVEDILSDHAGSGYLQFWTVSLILQLNESTSIDDNVGPRDNRRRLGIYGRSELELGTIKVQPSWLEHNPIPQQREFILICEGRDRCAQNGQIDSEEGWRYMVMLLDWIDGKGTRSGMGSIKSVANPMYAERVAIGSIGKRDIKETLGNNPIWKEIILG